MNKNHKTKVINICQTNPYEEKIYIYKKEMLN